MTRLWKMANIGTLAQTMMEIEDAWLRGDDDQILKSIDEQQQWYRRDNPVLNSLFMSLAHENEERARPIFRRWIRARLRQDANWQEGVAFARSWIAMYDEIRDDLKAQGKYDEIAALSEKRWQIIVEEGEAYQSELDL